MPFPFVRISVIFGLVFFADELIGEELGELAVTREAFVRVDHVQNAKVERIRITLIATPTGELEHVQLDTEKPLRQNRRLALTIMHNDVVKRVNKARGAGLPDPEVELIVDGDLRFDIVSQALSELTIQQEPDGIVPIVRKVILKEKK